MPRPRFVTAVAGAVLAAGAAGVIAVAGTAQAATGTPLPAHVFAPYFQAYSGGSLSSLSAASGAKYLTMAFLQTASVGSCTVYWDGDTGTPVSSSVYGSDISTIRASGGDVVPSFGGYAADNGGTEIADSCTDVNAIAAAYEKVVTTYNVTRLDLDTEDNSLTNSAGIDRRNKAIKLVEDWASTQGRTVQFVYTLPTSTSGLEATGLAVLQNAVSNGARVDIVNVMTFDYYDGASHEMASDTKTAAAGLYSQLRSLYPSKTASQLWSMVGITEMIGIDDYGAAETFTTADSSTVESWAAGTGIGELSFWALQRDNGGCPGTVGSDSCSGVSQSTWQFSHAFEPFTSGTSTSSPSPSPSATRTTSPSPSPTPTATGSAGGVTNGGFETGALSPWTCSTVDSVVSSPVHSGAKALAAAATSSDTAQCAQKLTLTANHSYTLSAYVQGNYAFIGTTGAASDVSNWTSAASWTKLSVTFSTGTSGTVTIWLHGWYGTGTVYVDDVTVA